MLVNSILAVLALALLLALSQQTQAFSVSRSRSNKATDSTCNDPLACYLADLEFMYPDPIVIDANGVEVTLSQLTIHGLDIYSVPTLYTPPALLSLAVDGLGTGLSFHYSAKVPLKPRPVTGDLSVSVMNTNVSVDLNIGMDAQGLPNSIGFTYCDISPVTVIISQLAQVPSDALSVSLSVSDSERERKLQDLPFSLSDVIQKLLSVIICDKVGDVLATNVTALLVNTVDPALSLYLEENGGPPVYPVYDSRHYLHWNESIVQTLHNIIGKVRGFADLADFLHCLTQPAASETIARSDSRSLSLSVERETETESKRETKKEKKSLLDAISLSPALQSVFKALNNERQTVDLTSLPKEKRSLPLSLATGEREKEKESVSDTLSSSVSLQAISFSLDTLCDVEVLEPLEESFVTMRTSVSFESLSLSLSLVVEVESVDEQTHVITSTYSQELRVDLLVQGVSLSLDTVIAIDEHQLHSFYLDQMAAQLGCWLAPLTEVSVPYLGLDLDSVSLSLVQTEGGDAGVLEESIVEAVNSLSLLLLSDTGFGPLSLSLLAATVQGPLRERVNDKLSEGLSKLKSEVGPCHAHYPFDDDRTHDYISWSSSSVLTTLDLVINDLLGPAGLNKLFSCASGDGSGSFAYLGDKLEIVLSGLDSFYDLSLFAPSSDLTRPYDLLTKVGLGYCPNPLGEGDKSQCNPLKISVMSVEQLAEAALAWDSLSLLDALTLAVSDARTEMERESEIPISSSLGGMLWSLSREVSLALSLENFSLSLDLFLQIDKDGMRDLKLGQLGTKGCIPSTFAGASVQSVSMNVTSADIVYSDAQKERDTTGFINRILSFLTRPSKMDAHNSDIADELNNAAPVCLAGGVTPLSTDDEVSPSPKGSGGTNAWQWELFILVVACLGSLAALLLAYQIWGDTQKHRTPFHMCVAACVPEAFARAFSGEREREREMDREGESEREGERERESLSLWDRLEMNSSLVFHPLIPIGVRYGIPLAILGTVGLFLNSNLMPDAVDVMVKIYIGEGENQKVIDAGSIFGFGLSNTVHDMWEAKVSVLCVI